MNELEKRGITAQHFHDKDGPCEACDMTFGYVLKLERALSLTHNSWHNAFPFHPWEDCPLLKEVFR